MRRFKLVLCLFLSLTLTLQAQSIINSKDYILPIEKSADEYACLFRGDTLVVVVYDSYEDAVTLFNFVADRIVNSKEYRHLDINKFLCLTPDLKLYTPYSIIDLNTGQMHEFEPNIEDIRDRQKYELAYPTKNGAYLVYTDHTDTYFHIAPDNANREYTKFCAVEFNGTTLSEPVRNREGKIDCDGFYAVCNQDTLYTVWQESAKKSNNLLSSGDYINVFMTGKYYDGRWSDMDTIYASSDNPDLMRKIKGLFLMENTFYQFWDVYDLTLDKTYHYFRWSKDFAMWSDICTIDSGLSRNTFYDSINNLLYSIDDYGKEYLVSVFNGKNLKEYSDLGLSDAHDSQIAFDSEGNAHLFWLVSYDKVYNQYGGTGGQAEKATLTRYALHHAMLSDLIGE